MIRMSQCPMCFQSSDQLVANSDYPICRPCFEAQASSLRGYHNQLKEENIKNPKRKKIYASEINEILEKKLYLGNAEAAECLEVLEANNITHILVCGDFLDQDSLTQEILSYLDQCIEFIKQAKCVYVHCAAGIHRSPAIVCAYLMKINNWTYDESFNYVNSKRLKARKQTNFAQQLVEYEKTININQCL